MSIPTTSVERRAEAITAELDTLANKDTLTPAEESRFDALVAEADEIRQKANAARAARAGRIEHGDDRTGPQFLKRERSYTVDPNASTAEVRSQALTVVEDWAAPDEFKAGATEVLEKRGLERGVAEHLIKYSDPDYVDAYRQMMMDPDGAGDYLTARQKALWRDSRMEARATFATSGAVLPSPLDPSLHLSNSGREGSLRAVASVHQTNSDVWRGISTAGVSSSFAAEAAESADGTPALTGTTINVEKQHGMAIFTVEAGMDQPDWIEQLGRLIADEKTLTEEQAFWNGSGSDEPIGVWTAINGGSYEVTPTTAETLGAPDVYKLVEAVGPRFRNQGARFQMERSTYHQLWKTWNPSGTDAPLFMDGQLIGFPYDLNSSIDAYADIDVATTTDNPVIAFGSFGEGFHIADRIGLVTSTPQLLQDAANQRFNGTLGVYWFARTGSDILVDGSIAVMNVATVGA